MFGESFCDDFEISPSNIMNILTFKYPKLNRSLATYEKHNKLRTRWDRYSHIVKDCVPLYHARKTTITYYF